MIATHETYSNSPVSELEESQFTRQNNGRMNT